MDQKAGFYIRRSTLLMLLLAALTFTVYRCSEGPVAGNAPAELPPKITMNQFAGSSSCAGCHRDVYEKHVQTEHHRTSMLAHDSSILGSFEKEKNSFVFDAANKVVMEERDSGFYQVHYQQETEVRKGRFDLVIGSGRKGQSYLSWLQDSFLVQMPITYFTPGEQWSNSPGYPPTKVVFNRPITARCLECHSTFIETQKDAENRFDKFDRSRMILAIACEKCHGPAANHVQFQTQNPEAKEAKFIVNPAKISRERQLDLCALCHGGQLTKTKPSFQFTAGDTLTNYFSLQTSFLNAGNIDVHGNQFGLLSLSKCFSQSSLTCTSCHNVHEKEAAGIQAFSNRCLSCHGKGHNTVCKMTAAIGPAITKNCIDCHMPKQPSKAVAVFLQGEGSPTPALMRTHYIKPYPDEVDKVIRWLQKKKE